MNVEQQQQQHISPPPPSLLTTELYGVSAGGGAAAPITTTTTTAAAGATDLMHPSGITTTYVTISMMPPPQPATPTSMAMSTALSPLTTTSTFKTPLLPMPSLEDIEGGLPMVTAMATAPQSQSQQQQQQQQQQQLQQQQMQPQPIPGGILKYPTNTIPMSLPIDMGPGPPPSLATAQQMNPPAPSTSLAASSSEATLLLSTPPPMPMAMAMTNEPPTTTTTMLVTTPPNAHAINPINVSQSFSSSRTATTASGPNKNVTTTTTNKAPTTKTKCCCCFGGQRRNDTNPSASTSSSSKFKKKQRKQKAQTMCSALLTNLGICALLLVYTLLGSFIFLTIESEDTSALLLQQQRTLASTKRGAMLGRAGSVGHQTNINNNNNNNNNNHIYHTSHQQQQMDNGTIAAVATATGSTSSGAAGRNTHAEVLQGGVNNDFIYGDDDGGFYGEGGGSQAELALSADTYDVRQRTIENIWDITVSLNILYKENWTKLAALEIAKFQDQLIKRLNEDALLQLSHDMDGHGHDGDAEGRDANGATHMQNIAGGGGSGGNSPATEAVLLHAYGHHGMREWDFAKAFLYSLTVLTTIGYGNIAPRTTLGRLVTLIYALFGIPLTLVYLSSTGGILAKIAREVFSKALCCCLCSNCGYCCYDEKRMAEKERRTKRKRQQEEMRKQQAALQEPYYVRSPSGHDSYHTPEKHSGGTPTSQQLPPDIDSLSASESRGSMHGLSILAPILLCLSMMVIYILFGAVVLYRLEEWPLLDGVYFCFMSLSTIGFGDMLPGLRRESTATTWFCSIYIMSGMALTAMCFNVIHEEIVHRIRIVVEFKKNSALDTSQEESAFYGAP